MAAKKPAAKPAAKPKTAVAPARSSKSTAVGAPIDYAAEMEKFAKRAQAAGEAASGGGALISFKGGQLTVNGVTLAKPELDVILLDGIFENDFYQGKYDAANPSPPTCYAFGYDVDEMAPHEAVKEPEAKACGECPNNEWDSGDGGRGKACKNVAKVLCIAVPDDLTAQSIADAEILSAKIPVTSVKNWQGHLRKLRDVTGLPPMMSITRLHVRPDPQKQLVVTLEYEGMLDKKLHHALIAKAKEAERDIARPYPEPQVIDTSRLKSGRGAGRGAKKPVKRKF